LRWITLPSLLIVHDENSFIKPLLHYLGMLDGWEFTDFKFNNKTVEAIKNLDQSEIHFLVFSKMVNKKTLSELKFIRENNPLIKILYIGEQLKHRDFALLHEAGVNFCLVGENVCINLINSLEHLWENHWKRIPDVLLYKSRQELHPRAKKVLNFIENKSLKYLNISNISSFVGISESYLRAEFRKYFGMSFRVFKQKLLSYYEEKLLFEESLKPINIYEILKYKNLSGFSRSFKKRHGISCRKYFDTFDS